MQIDRQEVERRDFPIARRGYDPAAVDAHLTAVAEQIEQLVRAHENAGSEPSLAAAAGTQVQGIIQAAETAAADIERDALARAAEAREQADLSARQTREEAIKRSRAHLAAVSQATSALSERIGAVDGEVSALLERLHASATRLAGDLNAVDTNMGDLYDAASGRAPAAGSDEGQGAPSAASPAAPGPRAPDPGVSPRPGGDSPSEPPPAAAPAADNGDLDGARLVALNMALNGESRGDTDRYLAEHFQLAERERLIDEVYAAIEA